MRYLPRFICLLAFAGGQLSPAPTHAEDDSSLYYEIVFNPEWTWQDNVSLGDDAEIDRVTTAEYELELDLEYSVDDRVYLFFNASLIDDSERVEPANERESESGIELKQIGAGFNFGEQVRSELKLGRMTFLSTSDWWIWWDEELDAVSLEPGYGNFHGLLAFATALGPDLITADNIDPELDEVERIIASLSWQVADDQLLTIYYLDQVDKSDGYSVGEIVEDDLIDEVDGDLNWLGIGYLAGFEVDGVGEFFVDLHYSRVSGDETLYEFEDSKVGDFEMLEVNGYAYSYLFDWEPSALDDWKLYIGGAFGSGDRDTDDSTDRSYRQTGLQGDENAFGELFQPEISNLEVRTLGIGWEVFDGAELLLAVYDYRQQYAADEVRSLTIETDPDGLHPAIGREIDLVLYWETRAGFEWEFVLAEFEAGRAYGDRRGRRSRYASIELDYLF